MKKNKGYTENIYKVEKIGSHFRMIDTKGTDSGTLGVNTSTRKKAFKNQTALREFITKSGKAQFRQVDMSDYTRMAVPFELKDQSEVSHSDTVDNVITNEDIVNFIHNGSMSLKPSLLEISDLKWKYLIRSVLRAKNIMMTGPAGTGKTLAAKSIISALNRPGFVFNLGSSQDPRATLVGNTQYSKEKGTFFAKSAFVKAIQTPDSIIVLDELTRAHPEAWNILMPVLDSGQRYLRLDEDEGSPTIDVAKGVTFIATANIGNEYTSTRVLDRALLDRFVTIEMDILDASKEFSLLKKLFNEVNDESLMAVAEIANNTREIWKSESGRLSTMISTRTSVEMASLLYDGFSLVEASEIAIYPFFSSDGGNDSERTFVKQIVQKYVVDTNTPTEPLFGDKDDSAEYPF